jgi:hypothetical protein
MDEFIGTADYLEIPNWWRCPEWVSLNKEYFTVVVDNLLEFLWDYYLPI